MWLTRETHVRSRSQEVTETHHSGLRHYVIQLQIHFLLCTDLQAVKEEEKTQRKLLMMISSSWLIWHVVIVDPVSCEVKINRLPIGVRWLRSLSLPLAALHCFFGICWQAPSWVAQPITYAHMYMDTHTPTHAYISCKYTARGPVQHDLQGICILQSARLCKSLISQHKTPLMRIHVEQGITLFSFL